MKYSLLFLPTVSLWQLLHKVIKLSSGNYEVQVYISKNSSITLEETTQEQCVEVSKGIGSLFGLTQKECFEIKIPEQIITNALVGGGSSEEFFSDERLKNSKLLIIEAESLKTPESLEDLQDNYLLFETKELGVSLLWEIIN